MNICILKGNLTRDPELRYTPKGTAVAGFGVAINRTWLDESGQKREEVDFFDCEAWGKTGEFVGKFFTKGKPILITGRLKLDQWDDKQSGQKRSKVKVVVERVDFCGGDKPSDGQPRRQPDAQRAAAEAPQAGPPDDDSGVPF